MLIHGGYKRFQLLKIQGSNKFLAPLGAAQEVKILELDWLDALIYDMRTLPTRREKAGCELNLARSAREGSCKVTRIFAHEIEAK